MIEMGVITPHFITLNKPKATTPTAPFAKDFRGVKPRVVIDDRRVFETSLLLSSRSPDKLAA